MTYFNKALKTLQALFELLQLSFHYERLFNKHKHDFTIDTLVKLLLRGRKLFAAIDSIATIFKLLGKRGRAPNH